MIFKKCPDAGGPFAKLLIAQFALDLATINPIRGKLLHTFPLSSREVVYLETFLCAGALRFLVGEVVWV